MSDIKDKKQRNAIVLLVVMLCVAFACGACSALAIMQVLS